MSYDDGDHVVVRPTYFRDIETYKAVVKRFSHGLSLDLVTYHTMRWDQLMYQCNYNIGAPAYNCTGCETEWNLGPVVLDSLWNEIVIRSNLTDRAKLCKPCMERHLGRSIKPEEEKSLLWNYWRRSAVNE